jgi:ABC-type transporter Mla MlaB component
VLRAETTSAGKLVLSGRIDKQNIPHLKFVLASGTTGHRELDLTEVTGVDADGVEFLGLCEAKGIILEGCPRYIRSWIDRMGGQET